jgi:hypothetical protein
VKRQVACLLAWAVGLALLAGGQARAAEITYTYKSLVRRDEAFNGTGETLSGNFEVGDVNAAGTVVGVSNYGDGEGGYLVDADGKGMVLSRPGKASPTGGDFGSDITNLLGVNDSGNVAMSVGVDRGDGQAREILFYERATDKWSNIARKGSALPGGTISAAVSYTTISNANDITFTGQLDSGQAVYLYDASSKSITGIAVPGMTIGGGTFINAWRPRISQVGRIVTFEGQLKDDDNYGAYMWKDGTVTELVRFNAAMPDVDGKATTTLFDQLRGPTANSNGDVAMLGHIDAGWGVFLRTAKDGKFIRIAGPGDTVAGGKLAQVANSYRNDVRIAEDGSVLFTAIFDNDDRAILLRHPDGTLTTVARTGQELKGVGTPKVLQGAIGGDSGLGLSTDGKITFPAQTEDGKTHLVLAIPNKP